MIPGINESKLLTKHISFECKCKFDVRKCDSEQCWNNDKCRCKCKKRHVCEKDYVWNPAICTCKDGKCLASIMDNSVIMCNEVIELFDEELLQQILMERKQPLKCKISIFSIFIVSKI